MRKPTWTRDRIIQAVREMAARGEPVYRAAVGRRDRKLIGAAWKEFRYWRNVLVAAGVDPKLGTAPNRIWTDEKILKEILRLEADDSPLNCAAILRSNNRLLMAAAKRYGNWSQALMAAGISPEKVTRRRRWSREKIIRAIQSRYVAGLPLGWNAMQQCDSALVSAARRHMGSWPKALDAAGVPHDPYWTRDRVINAIVQARARGARLNRSAFSRTSVPHVATRLFGSWDEALKAAGVDPREVRSRVQWTRSTIIEAIRQKQSAGEPLSRGAIRPTSLLCASVRLFGSWHRALSAAGFDPDAFRLHHRKWTRRDVIQIIQRRSRAGQPVNSRHVRPESIANAGIRLFGSWDRALQAAGINPAEVKYPNFLPYRRPKATRQIGQHA